MKLKICLAAGAALCLIPVASAQFPAGGVYTTSSLGQFRLAVAAAFQPTINQIIMNGGLVGFSYNAKTGVLTSPLLYDPTTSVGTSNTFKISGAPSTQNVVVPQNPSNLGGATTTLPISTSSLVAPAGFAPANGTDAVLTDMYYMNLQAAGVTVQAGKAAADLPAAQQIDPGEVASNSNSGVAANDFPAKSFFDIFTEITLTLSPTESFMLDNTAPLTVQSTLPGPNFPPTVVYTHTAADKSVPLYFMNGPDKGDVLGDFLIAGHGEGFNNGTAPPAQDPDGEVEFEDDFNALPEPAPWMVFIPAVGLIGIRRSVRRRSA